MSLDDAVKVAGILIPLGALILAYIESRKWRRELIGKQQMELAQRIGRLAIRFRNQFTVAVSPATFTGEFKDRPIGDDEKPNKSSLFDERYARQKRVESLYEILRELSEANIEAEIIFDQSLNEFYQVCANATYELNAAVNQYFNLQNSYRSTTNERILGQLERLQSIIYGEDKDLITEVSTATTQIQNYAKKLLR